MKTNTFVLNDKSHYGDGQHYFNCDFCGEQWCFHTEKEAESLCGAEIKVIAE